MKEEIDKFLEYLKIDKEYSSNTIETYQSHLFFFNQYLNDKKICKVDQKVLNDYIIHLHKLQYGEYTIANHISSLKSFYKFEMIMKKESSNPTLYLESPKLSKRLPKVLTEEEVTKLLDFKIQDSFDIRNKAMLELMYGAGLRVSELVSLTLQNIDMENNTLRTMGKGKKERWIPIGEVANEYLEKYLKIRTSLLKKEVNDFLFLNNHGKQMTRQGFFKILKKIAKKQGIEKDFSPHTLRHSFASHLLKYGADLRVIQELLGHSDISTTQIYMHIEDEKKAKDYHEYHPHG